jgi:hypothetical protein
MLPAWKSLAKEAKHMKLNDMIISGNNGEIYYENEKKNTIKIGTFNYDPKYNHMTIDLGICVIEYEFRTAEMLKDCVGMTPHMYWFRSQYVCDRYHGTYESDHTCAINLFDEVTPFNEKINELIKSFIMITCNRTWKTATGVYHGGLCGEAS